MGRRNKALGNVGAPAFVAQPPRRLLGVGASPSAPHLPAPLWQGVVGRRLPWAGSRCKASRFPAHAKEELVLVAMYHHTGKIG